jgi:hypothetical protein
MERDDERLDELIEDLLDERAPAILGDLTEDEMELAQTVAYLKGARPEVLQPDPAFVDSLRTRLFDATARGKDATPAAGAAQAPAQSPRVGASAAPRTSGRAVSRRRLLGALAGGAATGLALGGVAGHAAAEGDTAARIRAAETRAAAAEATAHDLLHAEASPYHVPLVGSLGRWATIVADDELAPGEARQFSEGALIFYLLRDSTGGYSAVSASCTHMGCLLTWQPAGPVTHRCRPPPLRPAWGPLVLASSR